MYGLTNIDGRIGSITQAAEPSEEQRKLNRLSSQIWECRELLSKGCAIVTWTAIGVVAGFPPEILLWTFLVGLVLILIAFVSVRRLEG